MSMVIRYFFLVAKKRKTAVSTFSEIPRFVQNTDQLQNYLNARKIKYSYNTVIRKLHYPINRLNQKKMFVINTYYTTLYLDYANK